MAWRIDGSVIRGEIDNREKGWVKGQIWLVGYRNPVKLRLKGNAHPDLAGCLLKFKNTAEPFALPSGKEFEEEQFGTLGDFTASRKVRVLDIPTEEAYLMSKRGDRPPEHMANSLYLEWFSPTNGRVVIESVDYELEVSAPEWRLTDKDNEERAREAEAGMSAFLNQLTESVESSKSEVDYEKELWDEFDYEKFMRESDARTDKYMELIDKYGDSEEGQDKINREMGWVSDDDDEETEEEQELFGVIDGENVDELVPVPETEGKDWIRTEDGNIVHPLQDRCFRQAMALWHECNDLDFDANDHVSEFITGYQIMSAKLAGALNSLAYGRDLDDGAFTVASLKRVIGILHAAQESFEHQEVQTTLPAEIANRVRNELFALRESILNLMEEFRSE